MPHHVSSPVPVTHSVPGNDLHGAASDANLIVKTIKLPNTRFHERQPAGSFPSASETCVVDLWRWEDAQDMSRGDPVFKQPCGLWKRQLLLPVKGLLSGCR